MLENVLQKFDIRVRIGIKTLIACGIIAMSASLPLLIHAFVGASGGMVWLPMYLPVLIGGAILGGWFGLGIGLISPLASSCLSMLVLGSPMPILAKLPIFMLELCLFGLISGAFSRKISQKAIWILPAIILAQIVGRGANIIVNIIIASINNTNILAVFNVIKIGWVGIVAQIVIVPLVIIALSKLIKRENNNDK